MAEAADADHEGGDDLSRQRRKRAFRLLESPVAGFDDVTLREVVLSLVGAIEEHGGSLDVRQFLADRGHHHQTVEVAMAYLNLQDTSHPSLWEPDRGSR